MQEQAPIHSSPETAPHRRTDLPPRTRSELWVGIAAAVGCSMQLPGVLIFMRAMGWGTSWNWLVQDAGFLRITGFVAMLVLSVSGVLFLLRRESSLPLLALYLLHYVALNLWQGKAIAFTSLLGVLLLLVYGMRLQTAGRFVPSLLLRRIAPTILEATGQSPREVLARLQSLAAQIDLPSLSMVTISGTMSINLWMITATPYRERGELALFMTPGTSESYAFVCCTSLLLGSLVHAFRKASPTWFSRYPSYPDWDSTSLQKNF